MCLYVIICYCNYHGFVIGFSGIVIVVSVNVFVANVEVTAVNVYCVVSPQCLVSLLITWLYEMV